MTPSETILNKDGTPRKLKKDGTPYKVPDKRKVVVSDRQKKLANLLIANASATKPLNKGQLVRAAGYSEATAHQAGDVIESPGVIAELAEAGFNPETAKRVVQEIMLNEENDPNVRLKASDMVFKVDGTYAAEKREVVKLNVDVDMTGREELYRVREQFEEKLREQLTSGNNDTTQTE